MQDIFKDKLRTIDDLMIASIKAVFDDEIDKARPDIKEGDNALLGEKFRAYMVAKEILGKAIANLGAFKVNKTQTNNFHKER